MDGGGDQLLAGAALAEDEDVRVALGHGQGQLVDLAEGGAAEDRSAGGGPLAQLALEGAVLLEQALALQAVLDQDEESYNFV